ncbi:hypothetical protein CSC22_5223 (plasmid) [Escherichia coli]|nr:hypothetical protein CSC22_5223 [Escherichia coli]
MGKGERLWLSTSWLRMATRSLTRCIGFSLLLSNPQKLRNNLAQDVSDDEK